MGDTKAGRKAGKSWLKLLFGRYYLPIRPACQGVHAVPSHTALLHKGKARNQEEV